MTQEAKEEIFIWLCNTPEDDEKQWVSKLQYFLEVLLRQLIDKKITFIRDIEEALENFEKIDASIIVLSHSFLENQLLLKNLQLFINHKKNQSTEISAFFNIMKEPLARISLPQTLQSLWAYRLYDIEDKESEVANEFEDFFNNKAQRYYWIQLTSLAKELSNILEATQITRPEQESKRPKVYLAETTPELYIYRHILLRELNRYGVVVFPKSPITNSSLEAAEIQVKNNFQKSLFSIHLIGQDYGQLFANTQRSLIDWQHQWAEEYALEEQAKGEEFNRYIWLPTFLKDLDHTQQKFLDELRQASLKRQAEEILQIPLGDLKTTLRKSIINVQLMNRNRQSVENTKIAKSNKKNTLYLIRHSIDAEAAEKVKEVFSNFGINIVENLNKGGVLHMRKHHLKCLNDCDIALIFFQEADFNWLKMKWLDLIKAPGLGRKKPLEHKIVVSNLDSKIIKDILGQKTEVIRVFPENISENISAFWKKIKLEAS